MSDTLSNTPIRGWCILTERNGSDVQEPTVEQLRSSVDELYNQRPEDHEHTSITMRFGVEDGTMYVLDAGISKAVTFSKFADQDYNQQTSESRLELVDEPTLVRLLDLLSKGNIEGVRGLVPSCGW